MRLSLREDPFFCLLDLRLEWGREVVRAMICAGKKMCRHRSKKKKEKKKRSDAEEEWTNNGMDR